MTLRRSRRWIGCVAVWALLGVAHAGENVGQHTIVATPTSAVLVSGGGANFTWLNVVNGPVSIDAALTGFSTIDDGYANAAAGTTLRLSFGPGVLQNQPGPDLVLLDANNDLNVYLVSTSHDNFGQQIVVSATVDTGVDRNYFLGGQGPTPFDVMAAAIDLSSLNVPAGQSVDQIRLFTEGPSNDPLGLGVLAPATQVPSGSLLGLLVLILVVCAASARALRGRASA